MGFDGLEFDFGMESKKEVEEELDCDHQKRHLGGLDGDGIRYHERVDTQQTKEDKQIFSLNRSPGFDVFEEM